MRSPASLFRLFQNLRRGFSPQLREAEELGHRKRLWIVHISDTPTSLYSWLEHFLRNLAPRGIIHTGDLADEIKIERSPGELPRYERQIRRLAKFLDTPETILVRGNHDNLELMRRYFPESTIVPGSTCLSRWGLTLGLSHRVEDLPPQGADWYFYGHNDMSPPEALASRCSNGIEHICCCNPETGERHFFAYPWYVSPARSRKFGPGL